MKYMIRSPSPSGTRPRLSRPTIKVDVLALVDPKAFDDDEEPQTERRPDLAAGLARVMSEYPEFQ
jgi:hypothetical protein